MSVSRILAVAVMVLALRMVACGDDGGAGDVEFFEKRIRPVLIRHCYECHSAALTEIKGGLRLDSREFVRQGGDSGPAVVPGHPKESLLLEAIRHETFEMPPDQKLSEQIIADFEKWIEIGAPDPRDRPPSAEQVAELSWKTILEERRHWWSLQPVVATDVPVLTTGGEAMHPIDAFVSAKQRAAGIEAVGPAPPRVLMRRASLVLTGLPPAPAEVEHFVDDYQIDPDAAYETLVDRLLNSPHFGEHWARHWMDVVRFAETHGYEWNHEIRDAWRYRDYLIRAFNSDVPYDQLVREHIAGDLLESPRVNERLGINESIIGTAFWRFGELGHDDCVEFSEIRFDALDNQIDTFAKAFQGLTISCARCHDHKIDAISTKDYYAMVGMLESCSQIVHTIDSPERIADVVERTQELKSQVRQRLGEQWLASIEQSRDAFASAIAGPDATSPLAKYIADTKLDRADPGYILGRLARREAGIDNESLADTDDLRQAHWLWYPEGNAAANAPIATRYFRRRMVIPEDRSMSKALCFFAGDDSVTLHVNGQLIGTGNGHPALVGADVASKLTTGANELAVAITNGNPAVQPNPGGWIGVIRVEFDRGEPLLFYSDANWSSSRSAGEGWQTSDFSGDDWVAAMELGKAGIKPWGYPWPKQSHVRREADPVSLWPTLKDEYAAEHGLRVNSNSANFEVWADFGASKSTGWSASGLGLSNGPCRAGEFTLTHEGDQVVAAILPAGLYTNVTSDRLNGSLRSPWVPKEKTYISVQLVGDGRSMVRPVVDTCGLNEFAGGGLQYLAGGATTWKQLPTSAGGEHRSFVELTTKSDNPRWPDRPGRAGTNDPQELQSPRSSFGVLRAVLHDSPGSPLPELTPVLPLFDEPVPSDVAGIAENYQSVARRAVVAWKEDRATDADVHWVNWLLKVGLLSNSANGDQQVNALLQQYRDLESTIPEPRVIAGLADQGSGGQFPVLKGGDPLKPMAVVPARYIEVIADTTEPFDPRGSGRRELAELVADAGNPLTARVMVNRVWHHLFGRGIVATPDDFGGMGEKPTHPELLDHMAIEFAEDGWSVKRLIRRIVLSRTFRQSSFPHEQAVQIDPGNHLLHHYSARRLSAEAVRDTILTVSGRLDRTLYGPSIHPYRKQEIDYRKLWSGPLDGDGRRSIYTEVTRMEGPQFLELFDFPNPTTSRGRRDRTNVPAQALALLNDPFVVGQAKFWAEQLVVEEHDSIAERVEAMFQSALGRRPDQEEQRRFVALIRQLAEGDSADDAGILQDKNVWQDAAHAVFNMKELIYVK